MANSSTAAQHRLDVTAHLTEAMAVGTISGENGVALRAIPFLNQIGIRVRPGTTAAAAIERQLGVPLPERVGPVTSGYGSFVLWQSPDEFLVVTDPDLGAMTDNVAVTATLSTALGDEPGSVVDLSANRVLFELSGPSARAVLESGCAIDLHPRAFPNGTAVQSTIARVPAIVWKRDDDRFFVLVRASFVDYTVNWLLDAMREFSAGSAH